MLKPYRGLITVFIVFILVTVGYLFWEKSYLKPSSRYKEITEKYNKLVRENPENAETYFNWGGELENISKYEEAIEKYKKVAVLNPKYYKLYNVWGNLLIELT